MSPPLQALETWAALFLEKLGPRERKHLAVQIARELRKLQARRIRQQKGPDGEAWEPRKKSTGRLRQSKKAKLHQEAKAKQPMMSGLRRAKFLKAQGTANDASLEFASRAARIARVHHFGETDAVNRSEPLQYDYPERPLLGFGDDDLGMVGRLVMEHIER